ncbi:hypothetical protein TCAL_05115 [Tigriopus californicus]|uniref:Translation elongation factor EF1B beta/delta subunit guanine nucleotide exchange domain-containing protein n=1 Tax=Tigriopus californicus TaxID=6832 RepID=A0A553PNT2_TIGCA|nr:hypothetical protein TCAL_05115 [Tigriopus californicus]|eukprot:TCALIF_05115-PA protein Name:"Similar to eef1b Elongation factor 1-beta (Xenopus laevis)" AED:0.12 eAED:0.12 QI:114/0.5/0.66/1/1/1/3/118/164
MFSDLKSEAGLKKLNGYLADKSYIEGFVPTSADVEVFKAVGQAPAAAKLPHVARWYRHLKSFNGGEQGKFAKAKKADYASGGAAAPAKDDDDDVDLFGSDEDEEEEDAEKARVPKFVPVGYGIKKLTIMCTVEDAKVSIDELQEKITDMEDFVQSCDVAAMNKI